MDEMASGSLPERRERRMSLVAQWRGSRKSQAAFGRERGLPVWKLSYRSKRGPVGGGSTEVPVFAGGGLAMLLEGVVPLAELTRFRLEKPPS